MNPLRPFRFHAYVAALAFTAISLLSFPSRAADEPETQKALLSGVNQILSVVAPLKNAEPQTFSATLKVIRATGLPKEVLGHEVGVAFQAPDRLKLSAKVGNETYSVGRTPNKLWMHAAEKKFGLVGSPDVPRFRTDPKPDGTTLPPVKLPIGREVLMLLPILCSVDSLPNEDVQGELCHVLRVTPRKEVANQKIKLPAFTLTLWLRRSDAAPLRIAYADGKKVDVAIELSNLELEPAWAAKEWDLQPAEGDKIETVALGHLTRFIESAAAAVGQKVPELGPVKGEKRLVARSGAGRLEIRDGTKVLFLKGTPEEMGKQHGTLMKKEVHQLMDRILYGVGVGSSLGKGRWFFGEIEEAQSRVQPFVSDRYLREMDALAVASGMRIEEVRLGNFFPELFHCTGFALFGDATQGGRMFHGRVLDYMKGVGLEQSATVIVVQPDEGNAWVNLGYAGFLGTVTAMNEKQIAIGEMGGRGEGKWDGKPMAQLMREVMEKASTIDEAVEIMRASPRTCEYYYVISDGKTKRAVGIAATPETFETIWAGSTHPKLPHAIKDTVLMSAGDRYEELAKRVQNGYGGFDQNSARDLMTRPVCMTSNIQSVLFAPDTLDFWVANADSKNVASHARYTHYNLKELLGLQETPSGE
jgi:isopenicillin-N N-acyltransferase-like protein